MLLARTVEGFLCDGTTLCSYSRIAHLKGVLLCIICHQHLNQVEMRHEVRHMSADFARIAKGRIQGSTDHWDCQEKVNLSRKARPVNKQFCFHAATTKGNRVFAW
jgi:hypothetical protein